MAEWLVHLKYRLPQELSEETFSVESSILLDRLEQHRALVGKHQDCVALDFIVTAPGCELAFTGALRLADDALMAAGLPALPLLQGVFTSAALAGEEDTMPPMSLTQAIREEEGAPDRPD